jgi:hypothetical protein
MKQLAGALRRNKKTVVVIISIVCAFFLTDYYIGYKQDQIIKEKQEKKERLEKTAFFMIFPDIHDAWDIKKQPEKYEAVIKIENVSAEPVYVTHPQIRAYVQTGTYWTEVPTSEREDTKKEQIYKLRPGKRLYHYVVSIDRKIKYTYYLMYGYMHVRFHISLFVLPESAFKEEEVIERYTDVYVYLKPFYMSDKDILAQVDFADDKVPIVIPMPPH